LAQFRPSFFIFPKLEDSVLEELECSDPYSHRKVGRTKNVPLAKWGLMPNQDLINAMVVIPTHTQNPFL
jgi:hypothetical protein